MRSFVPKHHVMERPWTAQYWAKHGPNNRGVTKPVWAPCVEPIKESDWMWFRGDRVQILTGPDKGKQGYINTIVQVQLTMKCNNILNIKRVNTLTRIV